MRRAVFTIDRERVRRFMAQGLNATLIAERLGTSVQNISRIMREIKAKERL